MPLPWAEWSDPPDAAEWAEPTEPTGGRIPSARAAMLAPLPYGILYRSDRLQFSAYWSAYLIRVARLVWQSDAQAEAFIEDAT